MEKRKKLLSAILSVSMIASAFTALPLSASAEGEQNSGEEVTATVSPSTTAGQVNLLQQRQLKLSLQTNPLQLQLRRRQALFTKTKKSKLQMLKLTK